MGVRHESPTLSFENLGYERLSPVASESNSSASYEMMGPGDIELGEYIVPDDRHIEPGDRHIVPDDRHIEPGDRHIEPGDHHIEPGDRHIEPGDRHIEPDAPYENTGR